MSPALHMHLMQSNATDSPRIPASVTSRWFVLRDIPRFGQMITLIVQHAEALKRSATHACIPHMRARVRPCARPWTTWRLRKPCAHASSSIVAVAARSWPCTVTVCHLPLMQLCLHQLDSAALHRLRLWIRSGPVAGAGFRGGSSSSASRSPALTRKAVSVRLVSGPGRAANHAYAMGPVQLCMHVRGV